MTIRKVLASKAKALKAQVRSTAAGRRALAMDPSPGYNNYAATTEAVRRAHAWHACHACLPRAPYHTQRPSSRTAVTRITRRHR